ncbi:MAG: class I SAM-dependent methyltransferase, partial [Methanosarcinales archaeon]
MATLLFLEKLAYNGNSGLVTKTMLDSRFWTSYFKVYDVLNLLIPYQELLETICDELEIKKGEKILEAGCGTGNLALKIKERGAEVVGLDNSQEALDIYRKKDPGAKLVLVDLRKKLPFPDDYFDKIASNNTLYIIPRERQLGTLQEFHRILKPGGKVV